MNGVWSSKRVFSTLGTSDSRCYCWGWFLSLLPELLHQLVMLFSSSMVSWMGQRCKQRGFLCNESKKLHSPQVQPTVSTLLLHFLWLWISWGYELGDGNKIAYRETSWLSALKVPLWSWVEGPSVLVELVLSCRIFWDILAGFSF